MCVCISKAKQSKAKKERKKLEKTSGSRHVMDRTGQDRALYGPIYKTKATKGAFCFFPSFLPSFLLLLGDSPHRFRLSIYLSIGKQLGEVQGGREGGREF